MRIALAALLLASCVIEPPDSGSDYPGGDDGWGSGWGGTDGTSGFACHTDSVCGSGSVCARNGECAAAANVRAVHANWTMQNLTANDTTCANARSLAITFESPGGDQFGFSPVPCNAGRFTIDKLPTRYTMVTLSRVSDQLGGATSLFDASGNATLNLSY